MHIGFRLGVRADSELWEPSIFVTTQRDRLFLPDSWDRWVSSLKMGSARRKFTGYLMDSFNTQRGEREKEEEEQREVEKGRKKETEQVGNANQTGTRFSSLCWVRVILQWCGCAALKSYVGLCSFLWELDQFCLTLKKVFLFFFLKKSIIGLETK